MSALSAESAEPICRPSSNSHEKLSLTKAIQGIAKAVLENYEDPWEKHNIHNVPAERVATHLYDPKQDSWSSYETIVKIESEPFDEGAMRMCYRMKKLPSLPKEATNTAYHKVNWKTAPNYVAKTYKSHIPSSRETSFDDIKLQYEAMSWADEFNAADPPKKIHIIRAYVIEFVDRPGSPVMTVERFVAGEYLKFNTNSGAVFENRITPQTFSAFSFYKSCGEKIVVDVQGVGDLYTDPQVHSRNLSFGEGDLGMKGMALFFLSFNHSQLASALGLPVFLLSPVEKRNQEKQSEEREREFVRKSKRPTSMPRRLMGRASDMRKMKRMSEVSGVKISPLAPLVVECYEDVDEEDDDEVECLHESFRSHSISHDESISGLIKTSTSLADFDYLSEQNCAAEDFRHITHKPLIPDSKMRENLATVHHLISELHSSGRFSEGDDSKIDAYSILFHIVQAARLGRAEDCVACSKICLQLPIGGKIGCLLTPLLASSDVPVDRESAMKLLLSVIDSGDENWKAVAASIILKYCLDEAGVEAGVEKEKLAAIVINFFESSEKGEELIYNVGDSVSAAFGGGSEWYSAVIREIRDGGNYLVWYPEDDEEEVLTGDFIKAPDGDGKKVKGIAADEIPSLSLEYHDALILLASDTKDEEARNSLYEKAATAASKAGKFALSESLLLKIC